MRDLAPARRGRRPARRGRGRRGRPRRAAQPCRSPTTKLVSLLQAADREIRAAAALRGAGVQSGEIRRALAPDPLRVRTIEAVDDRRDRLGGLAFFTILILYGQLLTYGYWVASGVVEEKASRVVEVLLATIRPRELLAGKVIGLGLLGLGQLLLVAVIGVLIASASGAVDVDGELLTAVGLSLLWFVLGYAFFACAVRLRRRARAAPGGAAGHHDAR